MANATLRERARVASLSRSRRADDPDLLDARRNLAAANLEAHVKAIVATAPPLTAAQAEKIATILHHSVSGGDAA